MLFCSPKTTLLLHRDVPGTPSTSKPALVVNILPNRPLYSWGL